MKVKNILLVEDDYLDIESVKRALKKLKIEHNLMIAHNGVDALGILTSEDTKVTPDVILLDLNMPKMNGMEVLTIIKNYYSLKNIKTFIITTSGEEYERMAAQNLGVTGYIIKPLSFKEPMSDDVALLLKELTSEI
ncbi:MAG: two-component response regulator [Bacteroidetes bacterium]|jgi:CheY-like chemotaxis protein|nr:two-component response regulator [Bacteroidota bacterium]